MDPHIFANPDPGSQNLADLMDPDPVPKHCFKYYVTNLSIQINVDWTITFFKKLHRH